jgi:two-component system, chemotaxis family, protein-glutamate methylesterase/glutaminase
VFKKDIIVIGSSAGGIDALKRLCAQLPASLPAAVFIAQHLSPTTRSILPQILARMGPLPALSPEDGAPIEHGKIYVAAPDRHMLIRHGRILMRRGPHENRTRPSANALFRSAAIAYGGRVIGIVLTGLLDDGTEGLISIKAAGGTSIAQDPDDAEWSSMPKSALLRDHVDHCVPLTELGPLLERLVNADAPLSIPLPEELAAEDRIAAQDFAVASTEPRVATPGEASAFSCPDCGGVLNQIEMADEMRFRCQVGHAFTPLGLADAQNDGIERALGVAVRTHKERIRLFEQMGHRARMRGLTHALKRWEDASFEAAEMVSLLERAMVDLRKPTTDAS